MTRSYSCLLVSHSMLVMMQDQCDVVYGSGRQVEHVGRAVIYKIKH